MYAQGASAVGPGAHSTTYKLKWYIPNELVDNVRGVERTFRVSIEVRSSVCGGIGDDEGGGGGGEKEEEEQDELEVEVMECDDYCCVMNVEVMEMIVVV